MIPILLLASLCALSVMASVKEFNYCSLNNNCSNGLSHVMCQFQDEYPGENCLESLNPADYLLPEEQQNILKIHNVLRESLLNGSLKTHPKASHMNTLVWDKELEMMARRWATQCIYDKHICAISKDGTAVGVNMATTTFISYESLTAYPEQIEKWFKQSELYHKTYLHNYTQLPESEAFTQIVWANTTSLGCERILIDVIGDRQLVLREILTCLYKPKGNNIGEMVYRAEGSVIQAKRLLHLAVLAVVSLKLGTLSHC